MVNWVVILLIIALRSHASVGQDSHTDSGSSSQGPITSEVCELETFTASCVNSTYITVDSAFIGRLHLGRCLRANYGYLGCSADVSSWAKERCDNQTSCQIDDLDQMALRREFQPCPPDFKTFFQITYTCDEENSLTEEVCSFDSLTADCGHNEVLHISSAYYGRMRLGRCLTTDYHIGCKADVVSIVRNICEGHRNCSVVVPNSEMHRMTNCSQDLSQYLEVTYTCVSVNTACRLGHFSATCGDDEEIVVTSSMYGVTAYDECPPNGYIGCNMDVLTWISAQCAGKQSCDVMVPQDELHGSLPCPSELKMFMEVGHTCVPTAD